MGKGAGWGFKIHVLHLKMIVLTMPMVPQSKSLLSTLRYNSHNLTYFQHSIKCSYWPRLAQVLFFIFYIKEENKNQVLYLCFLNEHLHSEIS